MGYTVNSKYLTLLNAIVLTLIFFCIPEYAPAQKLSPKKMRLYTTADGLPTNSVLCIDQDKADNLWIGTARGASKFDGKSFTNYGAAEGFSDKSVWAILCDSRGFVWFGTNGDGLFRFDGKTWERFTQEKNHLPSDNFFNGFIYEDTRGNIWASPQFGAHLLRYDQKHFETVSFQVADIAEDQNRNIIYAVKSNSFFLFRLSPSENDFRIINNEFHRTRNIAVDKKGQIWVATETCLAKSDDSGTIFRKFRFRQENIGLKCYNLFVDRDNQVWAAYPNAIVRFDGKKFHYYRQENGLPKGSYKYVFQDRQHHLWFCALGGLAKYDRIAPSPVPPESLPDIVKTTNMSFQFKGDDGKFGSPPEELSYEFKFRNKRKWQKTENGQVYIDHLQNRKKYEIQLRVTDSFGNSAVTAVSFRVQLDIGVPTVKIVNQHVFSEPVESSETEFLFEGKDDRTAPKNLLFSFQLEKEEQIYQDWTEWSDVRKAAFRDLRSGKYTFSIKARDRGGNESEVSKTIFTLDSPLDKPEIVLTGLSYCYFREMDNRPVLRCDPVKEIVMSDRISFSIEPADIQSEKKRLKYSVLLRPRMQNWTVYRDDNLYEFSDLPSEEYNLSVRAKDTDGFISRHIEVRFRVVGTEQFPKTEIFKETLGRGKIVGRLVSICAASDFEGAQFSYRMDQDAWIAFTPNNCFEFPNLPDGRHTVRVVAKNEFGIDAMPDSYEFDYERVRDLPIVRFTNKLSGEIDINTVYFQFVGEDDMKHGDKTSAEHLRYSHRLIPREPRWSDPAPDRTVAYDNLKNGSYFFQVKAVDKSNNESVVPEEWFFTIKMIPFYRMTWFVWISAGAGGALVAFLSIVLTRRRTKKTIYEQRYNPYVVGEAVHDPEMFFGRTNIMQDTFQSLKNNSLCLTGERRIGKTTLLEHINKNAEKPFFSFFCNLESVREDFFFSRIMQHLLNRIRTVWPDAAPELVLFEKERYEYDDLDFEEDIEAVLGFLRVHYDSRVSIIMCLDEIDATQDFSPDIHQSLRNVFQTYQGTIRMVAAGVSIKRGDWHLPTSPWYNFFEFKDVSKLDRKSAELLIENPVKGFYSYDVGAIDFIPHKTDARPFYIQMICKKAINKILDEKRRKVTLADVRAIYDNLIRSELNREFEIFWENLSQSLQKVIIQAMTDTDMRISQEHQKELMNNPYNHGHRVIKILDGRPGFSTMFRDWLKINYAADMKHNA